MKNIARIAVIGALMALGVAQSNAGFIGTTTNYTTNVVVKSRVTIVGTASLDGNKRFGLSTKVVLTNIASALDITLDKKATLELVHIVSSTDNSGVTPLQGTWRVRLINGIGTTPIDLSANVGAATGSDIFNVTVADNIAVSKTSGNTTIVRRMIHVSLDASNVSLEANGLTIITSKTSPKGTSEIFDCDFMGDGFLGGETEWVIENGQLNAAGNDNATEIIVTVTGAG